MNGKNALHSKKMPYSIQLPIGIFLFLMTLPSSIEAHLAEAGFSQTELQILRYSIDGNPQSLRELSAKTRKSTGVLDQAMKKLLRRKIMAREKVNGVPKFTLASMNAIMRWIEEDVQKQTNSLIRRREDFQSFVSTLKQDGARPKIEYFQGKKGIAKAYDQLLEGNPEELILFFPAICKEEDDPLNQMRMDCCRKRKKLGIPLRVLSHNTHLGKRYKERDEFCNRTTRLVDPSRCPISFEKIISRDTVACFNHADSSACFIRFPELAEEEKRLFEGIWALKERGSKENREVVDEEKGKEKEVRGGLKEFFFSKQSLGALVLYALCSGLITFLLYQHNMQLNTERVREKVLAIATTGAPLFAPQDIEQLRTEADMSLSSYKRVVTILDTIRKDNEGLKYVYIVRPTKELNMYEFVADSYGLQIGDGIDFNRDGVLGPEDEIPIPGLPYDVSKIDGVKLGMTKPNADKHSFTDQWGTFISGFAPIKDENGMAIAVLGIDRIADDVRVLTLSTTRPLQLFFGLVVLFVFLRLVVFHKPLLIQLLKLTRTKRASVMFLTTFIYFLVVVSFLYRHEYKLNNERVRERVQAIAANAVTEFNAEELSVLHTWKDVRRDEYADVVSKLIAVKERNPDIVYAYIMRPTDNPYYYEFVADAESIDIWSRIDLNQDGIINDMIAPGHIWFDPDISTSARMELLELKIPTADIVPVSDIWGIWISGHAPILDKYGKVEAFIGVDMEASSVYALTMSDFSPLKYFVALYLAILIYHLLGIKNNRSRK